jgi:chromosome segregation ATPase
MSDMTKGNLDDLEQRILRYGRGATNKDELYQAIRQLRDRLTQVEKSLTEEKELVKGLEGNLKACEDELAKAEKERDEFKRLATRLNIDELMRESENARAERDDALKREGELRQELESYRSIAENIGATKAVAELTTARQQIAELTRDKERLDWLETSCTEIDVNFGSRLTDKWVVKREGLSTCHGILRQAIDAARKDS